MTKLIKIIDFVKRTFWERRLNLSSDSSSCCQHCLKLADQYCLTKEMLRTLRSSYYLMLQALRSYRSSCSRDRDRLEIRNHRICLNCKSECLHITHSINSVRLVDQPVAVQRFLVTVKLLLVHLSFSGSCCTRSRCRG